MSRDLDFAVPPETITEMQAMFDVLLQRSTRLVSNSYFLYFQRLASAPSIRTWSAILQQDVIRIAINDATFSKGLNASVKTSEEAVRQVTLFSDEFSDESIETPDGGPGWWNALKGFFVSTEYIAAQKEILLAIRDHNSGEVKSLYGPLSRRLDFMERWLMDFRNSQLFSSRFYELRDIAADAVSDPTVLGKENKFKSAIEELVQFWIHRGNPARLSASGKA